MLIEDKNYRQKEIVEPKESLSLQMVCGRNCYEGLRPDEIIDGIGIVPNQKKTSAKSQVVQEKPVQLFKVQADCSPSERLPPLPDPKSIAEAKLERKKAMQSKAIQTNRSKSIGKLASARTLLREFGGVMHYSLSQVKFIEQGVTKLPTVKVMRKINFYKMIPNDRNSWFKRHRKHGVLFYKSGQKLAEIERDGHGRLFYRNGTLALDFYKTEETTTGSRYVIYDCSDVYETRSRRYSKIDSFTILGCFDLTGNCVVYDKKGNIRLKYNQAEGEVVDPKIAPVCKWKWHSLNDPPSFETHFEETYLSDMPIGLERLMAVGQKQTKKLQRSESETPNAGIMQHIEFFNVLKENAKNNTGKYKSFVIKMKTFKLNKYFAIHMIDQANVYLYFRDESVSVKLNLGMNLDTSEIIDSEMVDMASVWTPYEMVIPKTKSVQRIKKIVENTKKMYRRRQIQF